MALPRCLSWCPLLAALLASSAAYSASDVPPEAKSTEPANAERLPTGRLLQPAGKSVSFHGRPVDLQLSADGRLAFAKDRSSLRVLTVEPFELASSVDSPGGASTFGLVAGPSGTVYFTNAANGLHVFAPTEPGGVEYKLRQTIELPGGSFPCGLKTSPDEKQAVVCLSKTNEVVHVDLSSGSVTKRIPVGVAPFDVLVDWNASRAYVSNIGGRRPVDSDKTAPSAGTETVVDSRGVASTGSVSVVDFTAGEVVDEVEVALHPSVLAWESVGNSFLVCNCNGDVVTRIEVATLKAAPTNVKPIKDLPFGSMPNAVWCAGASDAPDRPALVALAGNNAVGVLDAQASTMRGLVPTGWYPSAIAATKDYVLIANTKGVGTRARRRDAAKGRNSHDHLGTVQRVAWDEFLDEQRLAINTQQVLTNSRAPQALRNSVAEEATDATPVAVPARLGEPSVFKHVIYVIKENRTFDQVYGDIPEARSEPSLCVFPERVTPNHHALARRFGVLDNYYCNGVLSADGHSWATEGNVTPYLERAFGGFARSYTFGDDPITYSSSGFLWDRFLAAGLSFRNYGEMDYAEPPNSMAYQQIWKAYKAGEPIEFKQQIGIDRLRRYSCREYPGWNMQIPDVLRMDRFLTEFREFEENGGLPNLSIVYLPQDHLGGGVTSEAHMADNDLALGPAS